MFALCEQCTLAPLLRNLIANSQHSGKCSICGRDPVCVLPTASPTFVLAVKALIRYHYSEWDYHSKLGGDSFESLLSRANPIFAYRGDTDDYNDFLMSFLDDLDSDDAITLFTAYGRDIYNYPAMSAVSFGEHRVLLEAERELATRNHFIVEDNFENEFHPLN